MVAVEESIDVKKERIKHRERELTTEVERKHKLLAKPRETSQTASRLFAESEVSLRDLRSKVSFTTAERQIWSSVVTEATERRKAAGGDVAPQLTF